MENDNIEYNNIDYKCELCSQIIKIYNKNRHQKSKKHLKKIEQLKLQKKECPICYEIHKDDYNICKICKNNWCKNCNEKIIKCPFCREFLS